jgi:phosphatidylglycerophosphatase A
MIKLKSRAEIELMRESALIVSKTLGILAKEVKPGVTTLYLDKLAEEGAIEEPLANIIKTDDPLYGIDESLAMTIANIYGTIGITSFGYLDKNKMGIMKELDTSATNVNTFLDDLVAGLAAAASAKIAHQKQTELNLRQEEEDVS